MNDAMQRLADAVQKASPIVWQAAYRQVWIEAFEYFCGTIFLLVLSIILLRNTEKYLPNLFEHADKSDRLFVKFIAYAIGGVCVVGTCATGSEVLERLINPTFAAIKLLKGLV